MLESVIQAKIKKQYEAKGWIVVKIIQSSWNGIPDLMCLKDGKTLFIEVKRPGNKPTALQEHRHKQLREEGFEVLVLDHI